MKISQLQRLKSPDRYVYIENVSKNRYGGLKQLRVKNKTVSSVAVPDLGTRCHVYILDAYLGKLPAEAFERDNFYVQPVASCDLAKSLFTAKPIGKNNPGKMVKEICSDGNIAWCSRQDDSGAVGSSIEGRTTTISMSNPRIGGSCFKSACFWMFVCVCSTVRAIYVTACTSNYSKFFWLQCHHL